MLCTRDATGRKSLALAHRCRAGKRNTDLALWNKRSQPQSKNQVVYAPNSDYRKKNIYINIHRNTRVQDTEENKPQKSISELMHFPVALQARTAWC